MKTIYSSAFKITLSLFIATLLAGTNKVAAQQNTASGTNSLPALLLSFTGTTTNNAAELNWTMENETNCKWFVIERSGTTGGFDSLTVVLGVNNDHQTAYSFMDANMLNGANYYRLRQVDRDGVVKYSQIITLYNINTSAKMQVFPNPASAVVNFAVSLTTADMVTVQVFNMAGVLLVTREQSLTAGNNQQSLAISNLKDGNYILKVSNRAGSYQYVQSFAKVM
ncbi:MAG TPA: T9SS type A sorting domain-containing protein [Puia sp.]|jgi:hypothetical protein